MQSFGKRVLDGWFGCELRYVEYLLASLAISWGGWLLMPWAAFPSTITYRVMHAIAPEEVWGGGLALSGGLLLCGLIRQSYRVRRRALIVMFLMWLAVWLALMIGNWRSTATAVYIHAAVFCALAYLRLPPGKQR